MGTNRRSIEHMYDNRGRLRQKEASVEHNFEQACALTVIAAKSRLPFCRGARPGRARRAPVPRRHYVRRMNAKSTILTAWKQASAQQAPLLAAGVAFYTFLSLFPALIASVLVYGLVASPETVARQSKEITDALPADAASLVVGQLDSLTQTSPGSLGLGLVVAVALAFYSASGGVGNLVTAINAMFGIRDNRNFFKKKLLALGLTVGAIVFFLVMIALVAAAPAFFNLIDIVPGVRIVLEVLRWGLLLGALVVAIGVLFRIAPDRSEHTALVTKGVLVASLMWVAVSLAFSLYVDNFGSYGKTYGALAGVVVLLLWLWIGLYAILLGATVEAVREKVVTAETVAEDAEIADLRGAEANGDEVPVEITYDEEVEDVPAETKTPVFKRLRNPFRRAPRD
ncbi:YihY/virulence factor BrkB family protein [Aeromicrobium chenweiae]|uniref:YihY/virulence factor BrkB family protein n=2 Tax=Aeromicrobium chenweiae TaxID=2079793 RepID=A0A2S0WN13_9ACTN|nr:YihY/virulence factor BrkB family protein [Aeromicrobium chenweiae]TGN33683.1 YihY/virulence factor BrkB family protein [Aeromicrobium chenweiae]